MHNLYHQATFLLSAVTPDHLPADHGAEVAFIGRSNAGKSSAINAITGINGLARSSKTPGRTQAINLFQLDDDRRLVDLPGYGFAKAPLHVRRRWQEHVTHYVETRHCLKGLIVIMDIRHPMKELDQHLLHWAATCQVPTHVLLTKADKLNHGATVLALRHVEQQLHTFPGQHSVQVFSALQRSGLPHVWAVLDQWLGVG